MITYRVFSPGVRFCHWIIAFCMSVLFFTGLYIGNPGYIGTQGLEPTFAVVNFFSMENIRFIHFTAAAVLIVCLLVRFYLLFTFSGNRQFPRFRSLDYWRGFVEILAYYGFVRSSHKLYLRNPLAGTVYFLVYVLMMVEAATGLAMYVMIRPNSFFAQVFNPINGWLGNEYVTHIVHHTIAWGFVLFFLAHVYLVLSDDIVEKNGEVSSMVTGLKRFHERPVDSQESLILSKKD